jgi:hypothetical protein
LMLAIYSPQHHDLTITVYIHNDNRKTFSLTFAIGVMAGRFEFPV